MAAKDDSSTQLGKRPAVADVEALEPDHVLARSGLHQYLDVVGLNPSHHSLRGSYPQGVHSLSLKGTCIHRIKYDPHVIGARDLFNYNFDVPIQLAPQEIDATNLAAKGRLRCMSMKTALSIMLTIPVLLLAWAPLNLSPLLSGSIQLAFATLIQVLIASPFYPSAYSSLVQLHMADVNVLIVLSTTAAYVYSLAAFAYEVTREPLETGMFFQTSAMLTTIVMIGRLLGDYAYQRAVESVSVESMQVQTAIVVDTKTSREELVDIRLLQYGDVIKALPDTRIPTDGIVMSGVSEVDESMITGEARLVEKRLGSVAVGGTLNHSGILHILLSRLPSENTVSQIASMVDEARFFKPKSQLIADRVAAWFVPVIVLITLFTFVVWVIIGKARHQQTQMAVVTALTYAIATLVVSCPCAIGLAVPMVLVIACGIAAKHGIVIKSSRVVETARNIDHFVFDKTGTLTHGELCVLDEFYSSPTSEATKSLIASLTRTTNHPVPVAVTRHLEKEVLAHLAIGEVKSLPGNGIQALCNGRLVRAGNSRWLGLEEHTTVRRFLENGLTVFCVTEADELVAVYGLHDTTREETFPAIAELKRRGIEISLVSGDDDRAVAAVAVELGISLKNVQARASPADKQEYVKSLLASRKHGGRMPTVLFCGDGTNDAVALTQASIGVHMSSGTELARSAADVVLTTANLCGLLTLIDLSRASMRRVVLNFVWSFLYNVLAVLLAAGAFTSIGFRLEPQYAAIGELVSIIPVILVAFQMKWSTKWRVIAPHYSQKQT